MTEHHETLTHYLNSNSISRDVCAHRTKKQDVRKAVAGRCRQVYYVTESLNSEQGRHWQTFLGIDDG